MTISVLVEISRLTKRPFEEHNEHHPHIALSGPEAVPKITFKMKDPDDYTKLILVNNPNEELEKIDYKEWLQDKMNSSHQGQDTEFTPYIEFLPSKLE